VKALRLAFANRSGAGFYLRAESFFNTATAVDSLGIADSYRGRSLHEQSHGKSFISLAASKFNRDGFSIMDEPEACGKSRELDFFCDTSAHPSPRLYRVGLAGV
jgi:predicted ATPase